MNFIRYIFYALLATVATLPLGSCSNGESKESIYFSEVKSVNKLLLAQMRVSKMATIDDMRLDEAEGLRQTAAALLDALKPGTRKAAYSYDTYLRAYIDLSSLTPDDIKIDDDNRTITLTLPPVVSEYSGRDLEIREDHYRVTGLRSQIDAAERARLKEQMNTALKEDIRRNPTFRLRLEDEGRKKARAYFTSLLGKDGYSVNINFKNQ